LNPNLNLVGIGKKKNVMSVCKRDNELKYFTNQSNPNPNLVKIVPRMKCSFECMQKINNELKHLSKSSNYNPNSVRITLFQLLKKN
jgi:hypothetical protein